MHLHLAALDCRFAETQWWYDGDWSIVDSYVNWVWFRVSGTASDTAPYRALARHDRDVQARPAVQRVLKRNAEVALSIEKRDLTAPLSGNKAPRPLGT